jgi:hypothetical protein
MQLTDEEREHIRLTEEYRAEVRAKLASPATARESWLDKLAVPLLIVIVSGLLVPWILGRVEENRRALDLQSRLIEQIVGDDAAVQAALIQYYMQPTDETRAAMIASASKYFVEQRGNVEWVNLHYGRNPALDAYAAASTREHGETLLAIQQNEMDQQPDFKAWNEARARLIRYISETKPRL